MQFLTAWEYGCQERLLSRVLGVIFRDFKNVIDADWNPQGEFDLPHFCFGTI